MRGHLKLVLLLLSLRCTYYPVMVMDVREGVVPCKIPIQLLPVRLEDDPNILIDKIIHLNFFFIYTCM